MVISLTALAGSVNNFGLPMATVHREGVTHAEVSALFWLNAKLSVGTGLFMGAMAPVLAWFYGEPRLTAMTLAMALGVVVAGLSAQHGALLTRRMRFGVLSMADLGALVAGVAAAIGGALLGLGYWALVLQFVVSDFTRTAVVWRAARWRPGRRGTLRGGGVRAMLRYGFGYSGSTVLNHISRNIDRVLVGFFHGPVAVGLYDSAYRWSLFPVRQFYKPLKTVAVSGLSRLQHQPETFRAYFRSALRLVFTASMPAIAFVFAETRDVVLVLLGDQWLGAVPILRVLCINAFLRTVGKVTPWLYLSQGQTGRQFRWSLLYAPVLIVAVAAGVRWGALGVAVGFTAATALLTYPEIAYCLRTSYLTGRDLGRALWRPALASVAAAAATAAFDAVVLGGVGLAVEFLTELFVFGVAYVLLWVGMPGGRRALADVFRLASVLRAPRDGAPYPGPPDGAPTNVP
ncbi:MAG: lipopolysaccharide biosynthesis protein, partial [Rhodothermales bacterium]|nr:lipopolysaccharide biosynthesis protein [Rhodothermales bacterium]